VICPRFKRPPFFFSNSNFDGIILSIYIDIGLDVLTILIKEVDSKGTRTTPSVLRYAIYIQSIESFNCKKEISKRLSKALYTSPWPLDTRWSMIDEKKSLDRKDSIKSVLPLVFKKKQTLVSYWHL